MSNIDKQWLQQKIAGMEEHRDLFPGDLDDDHGNVLSALRIALASLEAEPVAWRNKDSGHCGTVYIQGKSPSDCGYEPLYLAPPASVSVPDDLEMKPIQTDDGQIVGYEYLGERYGVTAGCAWNTAIRTFRAAMLQGDDGNSQWVACSERMPEKGRTLALFGKRIKEVCANYVDEGYIGDDGEFYFFDWEGGPRIDDCHPYDKAIVTHWMYWELPAAPKGEHRDA
ncbi:TPA: DUF551 domain-containing protein [Enterobacter kobei]|nr:DUF551 domain-containing protein [Enterobacter kobei]